MLSDIQASPSGRRDLRVTIQALTSYPHRSCKPTHLFDGAENVAVDRGGPVERSVAVDGFPELTVGKVELRLQLTDLSGTV